MASFSRWTHAHIANVTCWNWQLLELVRRLHTIYVEDSWLSDHSAVFFHMTGKVSSPLSKSMQYRLYRSIDVTSFNADLCASDLVLAPAITVSDRADQYNNVLREPLDKQAPIMSKIVTVWPNAEWYTLDIHAAKIERRKLEGRWRKSKLSIDYGLAVLYTVQDCEYHVDAGKKWLVFWESFLSAVDQKALHVQDHKQSVALWPKEWPADTRFLESHV